MKDADIIAQIQLYPHLSVAKLANKLQISQARLRLRLDRFRQAGVLVREGAKKNGRWRISDKFGGCDADGNLLVRIGVPLDPKLGMKLQKVAEVRGVPLDVVMQEMLVERVHNDHGE